MRLGTVSLHIESPVPYYYGNQMETLDLGLREPLLEVSGSIHKCFNINALIRNGLARPLEKLLKNWLCI